MSPEKADGDGIELWSEFAGVRIRTVPFGSGRQLEVRGLRHGTVTVLDPTVLDALSRMAPDELSWMVAQVCDRTAGPVDEGTE